MSDHRTRDFVKVIVLAAAWVAVVSTGAAQPASSGRNLVFYFDVSTMSKSDQTRVISASEKFLQNSAQAEDQLAVMVYTGAETVVKQELTKDRDRVLDAVRHVADYPAGNTEGNRLPAMMAAISAAEPIPGRKALLFFASATGVPASAAELQPLRERAAQSRVAFYSIDAQGLAPR